jgi:hypothetical protein
MIELSSFNQHPNFLRNKINGNKVHKVIYIHFKMQIASYAVI